MMLGSGAGAAFFAAGGAAGFRRRRRRLRRLGSRLGQLRGRLRSFRGGLRRFRWRLRRLGGRLRRLGLRRRGRRLRRCLRYRRHGRGLCAAFLLELGELLVLEREQLLQVGDVFLQLVGARLRLLERTLTRRGIVLARGAGSGRGRLGGLGLGQAHLVDGGGGFAASGFGSMRPVASRWPAAASAGAGTAASRLRYCIHCSCCSLTRRFASSRSTVPMLSGSGMLRILPVRTRFTLRG